MNVSMCNDNTVNLYYSLTQFIHLPLSFNVYSLPLFLKLLFDASVTKCLFYVSCESIYRMNLTNAVQPYKAAHKSIATLKAWCRFHVFEWNEIKKGKQKRKLLNQIDDDWWYRFFSPFQEIIRSHFSYAN